jgi:hypothetical protein
MPRAQAAIQAAQAVLCTKLVEAAHVAGAPASSAEAGQAEQAGAAQAPPGTLPLALGAAAGIAAAGAAAATAGVQQVGRACSSTMAPDSNFFFVGLLSSIGGLG